jgi:hypothetical protein
MCVFFVFVYDIFSDAASSLEYIALTGRMKNDEVKRTWKKSAVVYFKVVWAEENLKN